MKSRRMLVKTSLLATGIGAASALTPANADDGKGRDLVFLFVHGGWHAAAHWNRVTLILSELGYSTLAVDLPGSGLNAVYPQSYLTDDFTALLTEVSPLAGVTLNDYVNFVVPLIQYLANAGKKIVLVGHSTGGLTITLAGERIPDAIHRLVYLSAIVPTLELHGSAATYLSLPENASSQAASGAIADPSVVGSLRINPRSPDPTYWERIRQAFYNDSPTNDFLRFFAYLNPELPLKVTTEDARGTAARWGRIPRTFIRCTLDHAITPPLQDLMIRQANQFTPSNQFDVHTLQSSHTSFASMPDKLALTLAQIAQTGGR